MSFPEELQPHLDHYLRYHPIKFDQLRNMNWRSADGRTEADVKRDVMDGYQDYMNSLTDMGRARAHIDSDRTRHTLQQSERIGYIKNTPTPAPRLETASKKGDTIEGETWNGKYLLEENEPTKVLIHSSQEDVFGDKVSSTINLHGPVYTTKYSKDGDEVIAHDSGQPVLFDSKMTIPPTVYELSRDEGAEGLVPATLGAAIQESRRRWGMDPVPSSDLSSHSLPIVQKLVGKGLIPKTDTPYSQQNFVGNDWAARVESARRDTIKEARTNPKAQYEEYSPEQIKGASDEVRNLLRKPKNPNIGQQFQNLDQQMELF